MRTANIFFCICFSIGILTVATCSILFSLAITGRHNFSFPFWIIFFPCIIGCAMTCYSAIFRFGDPSGLCRCPDWRDSRTVYIGNWNEARLSGGYRAIE